MHILYVTSFNKKLYNASGRKMVKSFHKQDVEGHLLVTYESMLSFPIINDLPKGSTSKLLFYNLDKDKWIPEWTKQNEDVIPPEYGGIQEVKDGNVLKVWGTRFNLQAARWFRKIVALKAAVTYEPDYIIFADCDAVFTQALPAKYVEEQFGDNDVFYHLGPHRKQRGTGIESGFIGFKMSKGGKEFLQSMFDCYASGDFRNYVRWDDGYLFRMKVEENPHIKSIDLVGKANMPIIGGHVVRYGPFGNYFLHDKGFHQKNKLLEVSEVME